MLNHYKRLGKLSLQMPCFRTVLSFAYGCYAWAVFLVCTLFFGTVAIAVHSPARAQRILGAGARLVCQLCGLQLSIEGLHRLPQHPHVFILNHTSFMDPIALLALLSTAPGYRFAARQQFKRQYLLGPLVKSIGTVILKRPDQHHAAPNLALLVKALRQRNSLIIFPEGGLWPDPGLRPFHSGAFVAARQAKVPIVVGAIHGASEVLRPKTWCPHRKPIKVVIGSVFYPGSVMDASTEALMHAARSAMEKLQENLDSSTLMPE